MIELNNYEEFAKYLQDTPIEEGEDYYIYLIDFQENGKPADAVINFCTHVHELCHWTENWLFAPDEVRFKFKIKARNLTFNYDCDCDYIECENLTAKKQFYCKDIVVKNKLDCNILSAESIYAGSIEGHRIGAKSISCGHLKIRGLVLDEIGFNYFTADNVITEIKENVGGENDCH